jgi:hypothetical protein
MRGVMITAAGAAGAVAIGMLAAAYGNKIDAS